MLKKLFEALRPGAAVGAGQIRQADAATIRGWWDAGQAVIVDVREAAEHAGGAIPGAVNLPLSAFDPGRVPHPGPGQHLVLHCLGGVRCGPAAAALVSAGWEGEIVRMRGGITAWAAIGGPVSRPE